MPVLEVLEAYRFGRGVGEPDPPPFELGASVDVSGSREMLSKLVSLLSGLGEPDTDVPAAATAVALGSFFADAETPERATACPAGGEPERAEADIGATIPIPSADDADEACEDVLIRRREELDLYDCETLALRRRDAVFKLG